MPSIILTSTLDSFKYMPDMLKWQFDLTLPQSSGNELRRWQVLWQNRKKETEGQIDVFYIPSITYCRLSGSVTLVLFQVLTVLCYIGALYTHYQCRSGAVLFAVAKTKDLLKIRDDRRTPLISDLAVCIIAVHNDERIEVDEICRTFVQEHSRRLFQSSLFNDDVTFVRALYYAIEIFKAEL